jgi:hypothetical protein
MAAAGIRGVKVDFWCSDRQEAMAAMQALFQDTATRRMLVNIHGCTVPRGWQRTWPNLLTCEAVLGTESYLFEPHYTREGGGVEHRVAFHPKRDRANGYDAGRLFAKELCADHHRRS